MGLGMPVLNGQTLPAESIQDTLNRDDLGNASDDFQDLFFDALTQNSIENYAKALAVLQKSESLTTQKLPVYFEMGKSYLGLEEYGQAQEYFQKALAIKPFDEAVLQQLLKVYEATQDYDKAVQTAEDLSDINANYEPDLIDLLYQKGDYIPALQHLDSYVDQKGEAEMLARLRKSIYQKTSYKELEDYLQNRLKEFPENEQIYLDLIALNYREKSYANAWEMAEELEKINAGSYGVDYGKYKYFLETNRLEEAVAAMENLLGRPASEVHNDIRMEVLKDFNRLTQTHPEFQKNLLAHLASEENRLNKSDGIKSAHHNKDPKITVLEESLKNNPNDFKSIKNLAEIYLKNGQYAEAEKLTSEKLDIFPTQSVLYFYRGSAEIGLQDFKMAETTLTEGMDFVVENPDLALKFVLALQKVYGELGDEPKQQHYRELENQLKAETK